MKVLIAFAVTLTLTVGPQAFAEAAGSMNITSTPPSPIQRKVVRTSDFELTFSQITTIDVITHQPDGAKLPGARHRVVGTYYPEQPPCPTGKVCPQIIPLPVSMSVIFREWELRKDPIQARIFNICQRSIESAREGSSVILRGNVTHDTSSNVIFFHSIASCFVGTAARIK